LVGKYSIQNAQTAFILKKQGEGGAEICTQANSSAKNNIQLIYGSEVSNQLFDIDMEDKDLKLRVTGHATTGK
jgi:DNA mismatch repair ATPase MutL